MSRMLKALQQIEAKSPRPDEAVPDDTAIETALAALLEDTVEFVASMVESQPQESPPSDPPVAPQPEPPDPPVAAQPSPPPPPPPQERAEPYAELAENILGQFPQSPGTVLMFTSPGDGAGKTDVVIPLAKAVVERTPGQVLLVDANFRNPDLADRMGIASAMGLADVLLGAAAWQQVVRGTDLPRLSVLPGAMFPTPDGRPPEALNLGPLFEELRSAFRLVLVDTASLAHAEVGPIARCSTGTYLAIRLGHTTRRGVRRSLEVIRQCGGRVLGSVVVAD